MTEPTSNPLEPAVQGASGPGGETPRASTTYPLPRPQNSDEDARFTFGLALDVAEVLAKHGYPPAVGRDAVALMRRLEEFIYGPSADETEGQH